jgi:uncharacterized protein (TIGR03086 family)
VNVRAQVSHLVAGTERPAHDADHLGDDPLGVFRAAGSRLATAPRTPGIEARTYDLPIGQVSGSALAGIRITELLGHGWDLARATGQPPGFPDDVTDRPAGRLPRP